MYMDERKKKQFKRQNNWNKNNMLIVGAQYRKEFVLEYRQALEKLGLKQSNEIRKLMESTIIKAKNIN